MTKENRENQKVIFTHVSLNHYIRYSGEKTKTTFLKNISTYCSYKSLHIQIS